MRQIVNYAGTASGGIGALICAAAGLARVSGNFYLGGYEATTLFVVGTGLMVFACLLKLEVISSGSG